MYRYFRKLLLFGSAAYTFYTYAHSNLILNGVCSARLNGAPTHCMYESDPAPWDISPRILYLRSLNGTCLPLMLGAGFEVGLVYVRYMSMWFGIGCMVSAGATLDHRIVRAPARYDSVYTKTDPQTVVNEPAHAKFGVTIRMQDVFISVGSKFGYRTCSSQENQFEMRDNWAVGWFCQALYTVPLANEGWKLILIAEVYGDVKYAGLNEVRRPRTWESLQTGCKAGVGISYWLLG